MRANRVATGLALVLVGLAALTGSTSADASFLVSPGNPVRVDYAFPLADPFQLPVAVIDHTVEFTIHQGGPNALNYGEAYEISTFDANDNLLSVSSFTNTFPGTDIMGCACTGGTLDHELTTASGHLILQALSGSFTVQHVYVVGYDTTGHDSADAVTTVTAIAEPEVLTLVGVGLVGLALSRRRLN